MPITRTDTHVVSDGQGNEQVEATVEIDITAEVVEVDLHAKLRTLLGEATGAMAVLQTIRDRNDLPGGTLTGAQLSNAARQLQADSKTQARFQQETIRRLVAIARLTVRALDDNTNT